MKRTLVLTLCIAIIALGTISILVRAAPTLALKLGYDNSTYSTVLTGSYSSLYRVDNVWFVNGAPIAAAASTDDIDAALAIGVLGLVVGLSAFSVVVAIKKRRNGEN